MTMDVTREDNSTAVAAWLSTLIIEILDDLLRVVDSRVHELAGLLPSTIEIDT